MFAACSGEKRELALTDDQIERSAVLSLALGLIAHREVPWKNTFATCEAFCDTIDFLRKCDCEVVIKFIRTEFTNRLLLRSVCPLYVFMMAATMGDEGWATLALKYRFHIEEKEEGEADFVDLPLLSLIPSQEEQGGGSWPIQLWDRLPVDFLWAATTAWTKEWGCKYAIESVSRVFKKPYGFDHRHVVRYGQVNIVSVFTDCMEQHRRQQSGSQ